MKNLFVVIDGLDGSGKGAMVKKLHNYLYEKNKHFRILTTREPTSGEYGKKIRQILKTETDPMKDPEICLDLYIKDRKEHLEETIEPFLNKSTGDTINIVISDRYYYSTIAFQHTQGIEKQKLIDLNKNFRTPDITFILDLEPLTALNRIKSSRAQFEKFENKEFMEKLRNNFLDLKKDLTDNIIIVNASKSIEEVFNEIKNEIDKLF